MRQGAASEVTVPVSIKAHLSTVPEEAFEVINHDAPTREEPRKYHAAPFHSGPTFWMVHTDENEPFLLRVLLCSVSKSMPFSETRIFLLNAVDEPLSKGRFSYELKLPLFENHEERTVGSLRPRRRQNVMELFSSR